MSLRLIFSDANSGDLEDSRLFLLPGKPVTPLEKSVQAVYQSTFDFWKKQWSAVFEKAGDRRHLNVDNFLRQDAVYAIMAGDTVAGMSCSSFYRLDIMSSFESGYLGTLPPEAVHAITEYKEGLVMTFEYLCVNEKFRKKSGGSSVAELLVGLGNKLMNLYGARMSIGTAVRTFGMDKMAEKFGYRPIATVQKFNLDCAVVMNLRESAKTDVSPMTNRLVSKLWSQRITGMPGDSSSRKAA